MSILRAYIQWYSGRRHCELEIGFLWLLILQHRYTWRLLTTPVTFLDAMRNGSVCIGAVFLQSTNVNSTFMWPCQVQFVVNEPLYALQVVEVSRLLELQISIVALMRQKQYTLHNTAVLVLVIQLYPRTVHSCTSTLPWWVPVLPFSKLNKIIFGYFDPEFFF